MSTQVDAESTPFAFARMTSAADNADPILGLIADANYWCTEGVKAREMVEKKLRAAGVKNFGDAADQDPAVVATEGRASALFEQIMETRPTTIAGAAAKFEFLFEDPSERYQEMLADLRALAAKAVQQ